MTQLAGSMQIPIKIILILGLVILGGMCLVIIRNRLATRLFFVAQMAIGVVLVIFPELATAIAKLLGVGRGTDLLLYLMVLMVYAGGLIVLAKFRRLERQITVLTRALALQNAHRQHNGDE